MNDDKFMEMVQQAASAEVNKMVDEAGHITLGELVASLKAAPLHLPVEFSDSGCPGIYRSYRGYYEFIAIDRKGKEPTVEKLLKATENAIGKTFEGYKGGDYKMSRRTPVWVSSYGEASGEGIVGVEVKEDKVVLQVKLLDEW